MKLKNKFGHPSYFQMFFFVLRSLIFLIYKVHTFWAISNNLMIKSKSGWRVFSPSNNNFLSLFNIFRISRSIFINCEFTWFYRGITLTILFVFITRFVPFNFLWDNNWLHFNFVFNNFLIIWILRHHFIILRDSTFIWII